MTLTVTKVNSGGKYERIYSYSRALRVADLVMVSNSAGRDYKSGLMSPDPVEQTRQILSNLEGALGAVGANLADTARLRIAIPDPADIDTIMRYVGERFRDIDPVLTLTCTPLASAEYKVEIELTAYVGVGDAEQRRLSIVL